MKTYSIAEPKARLMALAIDYLIIIGYAFILFGVSSFIYFAVSDGIPDFSELGMNLVSLSLMLPVLLFHIIMEAGIKHATPGKRKMKIQVASIKPGPVRLRQVVIRNIIKFLPWQLAHMVIFHALTLRWELTTIWIIVLIIINILPFLCAGFLFRKDRRGLHDFMAGTSVINTVS